MSSTTEMNLSFKATLPTPWTLLSDSKYLISDKW